jgi:lycopene beta-cyclase
MARGRRDGIVIAGGGLAGSLAALAMARYRPEVPLLIVEETNKFGSTRLRSFADGELDGEAAGLIEPLIGHRWPGFYVAFPGFSRKLKGAESAITSDSIHEAMIATLDPKQFRLGTKVVAVREDALVLDGGETIKAEGAIDARGAANLSMLHLLYEARLERDYRFRAPHRVDRPVLIDATVDQGGGFRFVQCVPLAEDRLLVTDACISERAQPDAEAAARLDRYIAARGWQRRKLNGEWSGALPLPTGGDFAAFWRLGGARVAKLGLRGGFLQPATGNTLADAARTALLLTRQENFSGGALHDLFEDEARMLWKKRVFQRGIIGAIASAIPEERRRVVENLYQLDPGLIGRLRADRLGMIDRLRVQRALRDT